MFKRVNRLAIELPRPKAPDPNGASVVQELLGGRFGEMSTLNNYLFQSFNFRGKSKLKPFYDLVASITAEEFGHVELVSNTINLMLEGTTRPGDPDSTPLGNTKDLRFSPHYIESAQTSLPYDSMGRPWNGSYVVSSGNLIFDLLHNYFLECGARTHKARVYEMTDHPTARAMIGYLLVRGGVHVLAYAKALEIATGVDVTKMLPIPKIENRKFDATRPWEAAGEHRRLYTFSDHDYHGIAQIWRGQHPTDGGKLEAFAGLPGYSGEIPELEPIQEEFAPGISPEDLVEVAKRLQRAAGL
ncbi:Mn-containing catalase (includes spore coat protein CotJC) [Paenibacillus barengoltzii]|uniref:manganese catalase family protein n=1 Tax=Paenibacillus barengoltzii TaxID=343517 RepID=UPI000A0857CA|nr:manganese catalase family protein [Paenibacillus barengoltzii]SME88435.1 Mn-containing catalase (includes spore coat protein CotJC) [Paenibacillus barengoltzii]